MKTKLRFIYDRDADILHEVMKENIDQIHRQALSLPPEARAALAGSLPDSLQA